MNELKVALTDIEIASCWEALVLLYFKEDFTISSFHFNNLYEADPI